MFKRSLIRIVNSAATDEDSQRREFILNVLLLSSISLVSFGILFHAASLVLHFLTQQGYQNNSLSLGVLCGLDIFLITLFTLSKRGFSKAASVFLIGIFLFLAAYMSYTWGVDVSASLLFYSLVIVMSGILVSTRSAFIAVFLIVLLVGAVAYHQNFNFSGVNRYWTTQPWGVTDVLITGIMFIIIATVSWLSNREIERSLIRARKSEAELKEERDMLEVRVMERTEELRKAEVEKMTQAYRFVEFGRLASGIFHDLVNPLTALSLNIENIAKRGKNDKDLGALGEDVARAKQATVHMQNLMDSMRKHLSREGVREHFSLNGAINDLVHVLTSYARTRRVSLKYSSSEEVGYHGDAVHFTQVMTNLISNAIEAYSPAKGGDTAELRTVTIALSRKNKDIVISVTDLGAGISQENIAKIFEPFFTTKARAEGLGIGLSLAKRIVEKEFQGTLVVKSDPGKGASFVVHFPA